MDRDQSSLSSNVVRALENLYSAFEGYALTDPKKCSCFDFGPTETELAGISRPLREIPDDVVGGMQWYGPEWGTEVEVAYFLPRVMAYLAEDISRLENPSLFSFFKYKLNDLFTGARDNNWTDAQMGCVLEFFQVLLSNSLSDNPDVEMLIECVLALGLDFQTVFDNWEADERTRKLQVLGIFDHFQGSKAQGLYFRSERIASFLDLLYPELTPDELVEVNY